MAKKEKQTKEPKPSRFKFKRERLEVYMLRADDPIGHKQWRPIFRRRRSKELLTREQVQAIKTGRKVLRKEMKEQGLKSREDFEVTATNLGLYFDRGVFFFPIFLWFSRSSTVTKILATTALLATTVTVPQVVIQEVIREVEKEVEVEVEVEVDKDIISLDERLFSSGFILTEDASDLENGKVSITCNPATGVPCISIIDIPDYVHTIDGEHHDTYFAYTFYCAYESREEPREMDYEWTLELVKESENQNLSTCTWIMVFEGDADPEAGTVTNEKMTFYAERGADGEMEIIPEPGLVDANGERIGYVDVPLQGVLAKLNDQYSVLPNGDGMVPYQGNGYYDLYQTEPIPFESERIAARGSRKAVQPGDIHKYTVVIWLEGDDPECTDVMMGGHIGMNFQIKATEERDAEGNPIAF